MVGFSNVSDLKDCSMHGGGCKVRRPKINDSDLPLEGSIRAGAHKPRALFHFSFPAGVRSVNRQGMLSGCPLSLNQLLADNRLASERCSFVGAAMFQGIFLITCSNSKLYF
ncbi:hypothetical protein CDAR_242391 [Caerostris darwini]|uniref:Uncharacterized protein n=1 Tax=Caerostris darwini TaxID=1538125 RepID=A0AAV4RRH7_9ARAC|nr:hypothetical protein CDAR_242391 [Caerostris darwini]